MGNRQKGMLCILSSAFFFALMNMFVRLSGDLPSVQKSFFRNLIAAIFALIILLRSEEGFHYPKKDLPLLLLRSSFGSIGIFCNFYAVDHLIISDATMLNKLSPFFAIICSAIFLREKSNTAEKIAVVIAFIGAIFVIKPSADILSNVNSLVGMMGGLGAGIAYTCVRKLGMQGMKGARVVFFFSSFSTIVWLPMLILNYKPMNVLQIVFLLGAGLAAAAAQFSITAAYNFAPAKEISVFEYTQVIFAAVLGFVFLSQMPDIYSLVGYVIIIGVAIWRFLRQRTGAGSK